MQLPTAGWGLVILCWNILMERILVAEDDPQLAHLVTAALQHQGYTILLAINGLDAVEIAPQADLMVLDLGLPGLGGLEVIRELREAD